MSAQIHYWLTAVFEFFLLLLQFKANIIMNQSQNSDENLLHISALLIEFSDPEQTIKSLKLRNMHQVHSIAYKIKTNNLMAIQANPNFGLIRANTAISLRIKAIPKAFEAKLLINYANAGQRPGDFNQVWTSLNKNSIKSRQVRVWRCDPLLSKQPSNRVQQDSINSKFVAEEKSQSLNKLYSNRGEQENANTPQLQQRLMEEKLANAKIKQQLYITEEKLKQINQQRLQIKVNKSISIICEDYHTSFTTLLLLGIAVFVLGYMLAKMDI